MNVFMATVQSWRAMAVSISGRQWSVSCVRMAMVWLCLVAMCPGLVYGQFVSLYIAADEYARLTG